MRFLFWRIKYCVLYSHFKVHGCALIQKFKGAQLAGWAFLMSAHYTVNKAGNRRK